MKLRKTLTVLNDESCLRIWGYRKELDRIVSTIDKSLKGHNDEVCSSDASDLCEGDAEDEDLDRATLRNFLVTLGPQLTSSQR